MNSRQKQMSTFLEREVNNRLARQEQKLQTNALPKRKGEKTSGLLTSPDQREVKESFFAPSGAKAVRFTCGANVALTPLFNCKTIAQATPRFKTSGGVLGRNSVVVVPLVASNEVVTIFFQTTDSNGGYARWELIF